MTVYDAWERVTRKKNHKSTTAEFLRNFHADNLSWALVNLPFELLALLLRNRTSFSPDYTCVTPVKSGGHKPNCTSYQCWELLTVCKGASETLGTSCIPWEYTGLGTCMGEWASGGWWLPAGLVLVCPAEERLVKQERCRAALGSRGTCRSFKDALLSRAAYFLAKSELHIKTC